MTKKELFAKAQAKFGNGWRVDTFWGWRKIYSDCKVRVTVFEETKTDSDVVGPKDNNHVIFTYGCKHRVEFELDAPEVWRMRIANYCYPECPSCRDATYKMVASREKEKKEEKDELRFALNKVADAFPE